MASTADLVTDSVPDLSKSEKTFKTMTMRERYNFVKELITVEPLVACFMVPSLICNPALTQLEYEKSCKTTDGFNDTICDAIISGENENFTQQNFQVQTQIADLHSWIYPVQSVVPLVLILFLGSYSDRHKLRKPFLLLPIIGELLSVVGCIFSAVFMREVPLYLQGILQTIVPAFFGGKTMIVVMMFAYIADVSSLEMRTLRIGVLQIWLNACIIFALAISPTLLDAFGYVGTLLLASTFHIIGLIYGLFYLKESREPIAAEKNVSLLADVCNPKHVVDTFNLLLKKNPDNNRVFLGILMLVLLLKTGINAGELGIFFLYTQAAYNWGVTEFTYFFLFNTLVSMKGTIIAVPLFTKVFNWSDYTIVNVSFLDKIISNIIFAFSQTSLVLYIGVYVGMISTVGVIGLRSLATKVVSENDSGKAQTLFGVCESLGETFAAPIYNQSYVRMKEVFPGGFFLIGVGVVALCCVLMFGMYILDRKKTVKPVEETPCDDKEKEQENEKEKEKEKEGTNGIQLNETMTTHI